MIFHLLNQGNFFYGKQTAAEDLPDITTHHILSYLMLTKCPYTGEKKKQKSIQMENGTLLQICVQKFEAISIVLGEVNFPYYNKSRSKVTFIPMINF